MGGRGPGSNLASAYLVSNEEETRVPDWAISTPETFVPAQCQYCAFRVGRSYDICLFYYFSDNMVIQCLFHYSQFESNNLLDANERVDTDTDGKHILYTRYRLE